MKKILAFLLVLVMALTSMVGCDVISSLLGGTEDGPTLEEAKTYLFSTYKDAAAAIPNDYDLVGKVIIDGTSFTVTWTVDSEVITIKESSKANFWTVDLPDTNAEEVAYVLTATITDADGNKVEVKFNKTLPVIDSTGIVTEPEEGVAYKLFLEQVNLGLTLFATDKSQKDEQKYIETTLDPKAAADYYVEKVDGGYKWYTTINGTKTYVYAQGKDNNGNISKYIGFSAENASVFTYVQEIATWQVVINNIKYGVGTYGAYETVCISEVTYFKPDNINVADGQFPLTFMTKAYAETLTPDERPVADDPAADSTLTIKQAIDLGQTKISNQYTEGKYYITGTVKEIKNETYGNLVLTDGTNDILIYGTYDATGANRFDAMANKPAVGDTITVYGIIGQYSGTSQMKNGWITSAGGSAPSAPTVVDAPVAGTAYSFGMVQANVNNTLYYLAGGMDGYYMATTTDAASALKVYLEETTGGYYLYCYVGDAKTYINMVVSGTHVNGAYEATASTVYTYNTESKTLIAVVNDADYWFGTRNDKNYTTVGPCAVSYAGFYCQFYNVTDGEVEEPTTPAPTEVTVTEAAALADGTAVIVTATVVKITYDWSDNSGNMSVDISDGTTTINAYKLASKVGLGDVIKITGTVGSFGGKKQIAEGATAEVVTAHTEHTYSDATCTAAATCTGCGAKDGAALGHNYVDGVCSRCGGAKPAAGTKYVFDMGANGNASHYDGSDAGSSFTITCAEGEPIDFSAVSKVYTDARDATGNSCLKLGSSKAAGTLTFTVGANIDSVIIYVSGYKANDAKITVNGGAVETVSVHSNDGAYIAITIDTSVNKTVTFATADGGYRAMINTIELVCG